MEALLLNEILGMGNHLLTSDQVRQNQNKIRIHLLIYLIYHLGHCQQHCSRDNLPNHETPSDGTTR